jgi:hypothetical protein
MDSVRQCERDVEQARTKLAQDLALLRSPSTMSSFTESVKHEMLDMKDSVVEQAQTAVHTKISDFIEDLKAKAAANPAAALTIGSGIAWQFIRNPPIATALIGAGLFSLFRTQGFHATDDAAYLQRGKARLKEQVGEFGASAMDVASDVQHAVAAKAGEMFGTAKDKAQDLTQTATRTASEMIDTAKDKTQSWAQTAVRTASDTAGAAGDAVKSQADSFASAVTRARHDIADQTSEAMSAVRRAANDFGDQAARTAARVSSAAESTVRDTVSAGQNLMSDTDTRDKVLLGVAGLAVAAALGIAYQKRVLEDAQ